MKRNIQKVNMRNWQVRSDQKKSNKSQHDIFTKHKHHNEAAVRATYKISHILAKAGKPFADGELIVNNNLHWKGRWRVVF